MLWPGMRQSPRAQMPHRVSHQDRFHALDATRAFALLLGVVFHAAWSFIGRASGGPIVDVSGSVVFDWFFFASHTFRMQVFFIIAGFFGRLLYERRGFAGFARHRLARIGLPLLVGWFILFPLVVASWTWGGNVSGRNLVEIPLPLVFGGLFIKGLMFIERPQGGLFSLVHLWFLYYLLLIYVVILVLRFFVTRTEPTGGRLRLWADRWVARVVSSPWSILWLSLGMGLFLWPMEGWFGVDTPTFSWSPAVPVLLFYGAFFGLGWLLHRQTALLHEFKRHWRWQLTLGLVLSVVAFGVFRGLTGIGIGAGPTAGPYPSLWPNQITDWPRFLTRLKSADQSERVPAELANFWHHLPEPERRIILLLSEKADVGHRTGVCESINRVLHETALFRAEPLPLGVIPKASEAHRARISNRLVLERLFEGFIISDLRELPWYWPVKLVYSIGYGLVMWLLVFGTLGFFQARCPAHSPAWRYVADSSYWIYLIHLPLVPVLQVWMFSWPWPSVIKFTLLNLIAFPILFASYNYLVRSTWIGELLNGRKYPFVAWPFGPVSGEAGDLDPVSATRPPTSLSQAE
jgi:peptidoglycan/LPS O-acetylase OafA/YrhL